jgi:Tfp pilus assembly protein PilF
VQLDRAERALYASDCAEAMPAARSSAAWLGARAQPYEILGLCDMQRDQPQPALTEMHSALSRDPGSWEAHYMLALAEAQAGEDPRGAALTALRMNPRGQLTREAARVLLRSHPRQWPERARSLRAAALESKDLSILPA